VRGEDDPPSKFGPRAGAGSASGMPGILAAPLMSGVCAKERTTVREDALRFMTRAGFLV